MNNYYHVYIQIATCANASILCIILSELQCSYKNICSKTHAISIRCAKHKATSLVQKALFTNVLHLFGVHTYMYSARSALALIVEKCGPAVAFYAAYEKGLYCFWAIKCRTGWCILLKL